jgi:MFS family permease
MIGEKKKSNLRQSMAKPFAALKYPNFLLWFIGQLISMVGTWMQTTAQGFLVYQLTHSPAYLGYVTFASGIPTVMMLYGGVVLDRVPRRNLMIVTQTLMLILAFVLAWLTFTGRVQVWHILLLAFLLGIVNAFDAPARQAIVVDLVDKQDLTNAIALNSTLFQSATVVGPAVAGLIYAALGPAWCFAINGVSFVGVIAALLGMHLPPRHVRPRETTVAQEVIAGFRFLMKDSILRTLVVMIGAVGLFTTASLTLFPAWSVTVLHGNAATNGWLQSARGLGALIGAFTIASLGRFDWKGRLLTIGTFFFPSMLIVFALIHRLSLSLAALIAAGWGFLILVNIAGTLLQTYVPEELRGRVTGLYSLVAFGSIPIGGLAAGAMAGWIGLPSTIILGAAAMLVFSTLFYLLLPQLRRLE